jgi:hypothetical protein
MLPCGKKGPQALARAGTQFGAAETDCVEAEGESALADQVLMVGRCWYHDGREMLYANVALPHNIWQNC